MFHFGNKKIIIIAGVISGVLLVFGAGFLIGKLSSNYYVPQPGSLDFSLFWDSYNRLQEDFVDPSKISAKKIIYGAIEGMAESVGDPYTTFFDPEEAKRFRQDMSGSFEGIGVEVGIKKGQLTVIAPLPETPGQKAGLKSGDAILKIDKKETTDMTTEEAVTLIRGKKGTVVTLTIFRDGFSASKDIEIIRGTIKIPSIDWSLKEDNVAYIHIYQFDDPLQNDFQNAAKEILASPAKKIVLDLRDNPGGYLETAQWIAGWFLQKGKVVTIEDFGGGERKEYKTSGSGVFANYPLVVLINGGSASASEILAGCLRDNRNIKLVGEKSFGKGSVQEVQELKDGSFLKITIAKWLTPKGASISEVGLTPDVKVEITEEDENQNRDPQLSKALEIVENIK